MQTPLNSTNKSKVSKLLTGGKVEKASHPFSVFIHQWFWKVLGLSDCEEQEEEQKKKMQGICRKRKKRVVSHYHVSLRPSSSSSPPTSHPPPSILFFLLYIMFYGKLWSSNCFCCSSLSSVKNTNCAAGKLCLWWVLSVAEGFPAQEVVVFQLFPDYLTCWMGCDSSSASWTCWGGVEKCDYLLHFLLTVHWPSGRWVIQLYLKASGYKGDFPPLGAALCTVNKRLTHCRQHF